MDENQNKDAGSSGRCRVSDYLQAQLESLRVQTGGQSEPIEPSERRSAVAQRFFFFSAWSAMPQQADPRLFWVTFEDAETRVGGGAASFLEGVLTRDPEVFVAVQPTIDQIPTCLCCHDFGERHEHMATLFHWDAMTLEKVKPRGVLAASKPAPLCADDIEFVFCQLAHHPNYQGQTVIAIAEDYTIVELQGDEIRRVEPS